MTNASVYFKTAREREAIRRRRLAGDPQPWTNNRIFREWRFCNVHRENDRTTIWFRDNIRSKVSGLRAVEATMAFRWFNRIETAERILDLLIDGWDGHEAYRRLQGVNPVVTGAYMMNTPPGFGKLEGVIRCIDMALPHLPKLVERWGESLEAAFEDLLTIDRVGRFVGYEIVTDLRWTDVLRNATDIMTWANAGPGCARGLGFVDVGEMATYAYGSKSDQAKMLPMMRELLEMSRDPENWPYADQPWEMREVEHWLCECAKYVSALQGNRLKRRFKVGGGLL